MLYKNISNVLSLCSPQTLFQPFNLNQAKIAKMLTHFRVLAYKVMSCTTLLDVCFWIPPGSWCSSKYFLSTVENCEFGHI